MIKHKISFFLVFLAGSLSGLQNIQAQHSDLFLELMEKSQMKYESIGDYQIDTFYELFQLSDLSKVSPKESYNGVYAKKGSASYSKIGPIEFVIQKGEFIQINHELSEIYYTQMEDSGAQSNPIDMSQFSDEFYNVTVKEIDQGWVCELVNPKDIETMPYFKVVYYLDHNHHVINQELYPTKVISFTGSDNGNIADRAVLHVKLSPPKEIVEKKLFEISNYVTRQGNRIIPIQGLEKYELIKV